MKDGIDVGDRFWRRDVGDGFGHFGHQDPLSFYISVGHQHSKDVTNISKISPTLSHQQHCHPNEKVAQFYV